MAASRRSRRVRTISSARSRRSTLSAGGGGLRRQARPTLRACKHRGGHRRGRKAGEGADALALRGKRQPLGRRAAAQMARRLSEGRRKGAECSMLPPVPENGHYLARTAFRAVAPGGGPVPRRSSASRRPVPPTRRPPPISPASTRSTSCPSAGPGKTATRNSCERICRGLSRYRPAGAWAWRGAARTPSTARPASLPRTRSVGTCHLYAVDDAVVFKMPESAEASPAP